MIDSALLYPNLIRRRAEEHPDHEFLRDTDGRRLTYGAAAAQAGAWSQLIDSLDLGPDPTVVTMLPTSIDYAVLTIGIAWSAALEVPANTAYQGRMLRHILDDSEAEVIVVHWRCLDRLRTLPGPRPPHVLVVGEQMPAGTEIPAGARRAEEALGPPGCPGSAGSPGSPGPPVRAGDRAWVLYTSGTTGPSKGVICTWAQTYLTATGIFPFAELTGEDVYYCALPMFHIAGRLGPYLAALLDSRCVVRESFRTDTFWSDVRTHGCTTTQLFPATANFLFDAEATAADAENPLRNVLLAPLTENYRRFQTRFGVRICTTWNMTETSAPIASRGFDPADVASCGVRRDGFELRIIDDEGYELGPGEFGELVIRSAEPHALMAGYWHRPDQTVDSWRDLWFHTGDGFTRDAEGNYYYVDRRKDALRRRGENISSAEVEADVLGHPDVVEAAVVGVPSPLGEDEVMAFVVRANGSELTEAQLVDFLRPVMASFMVPRYVEFVGELPKTPTFRVKKSELRARGVTARTFDAAAAHR